MGCEVQREERAWIIWLEKTSGEEIARGKISYN